MSQNEEKKYLADIKIHTTFDNSSEHRSCQTNKNLSTIVRHRRYRSVLERSWKPQNGDSNETKIMLGGHQDLHTFGNSSERRYFQAYFEHMEIQIMKKNKEKLRKIEKNSQKSKKDKEQ